MHTLAKKELHEGMFGFIFRSVGTIPVDLHSKENKQALAEAIEVLKSNHLENISPEAKRNYSNELLLPFKYGAVSMSQKTGAPIIPYAIAGEYKLFSKNLTVIFGNPIYAEEKELYDANKFLYNSIKELNLNFNALALQSIDACGCLKQGDKVLSVMPIFHGFGLGVCIHTTLNFGGTAIILPKFSVVEFHKLLLKYKPNIIAGVPTIYEILLQNNELDRKDLSFIKCVISGGDSLSVSTKKKLNKLLSEHGCTVCVREGYGLTECVTGSCLMPNDSTKIDSVGLPYADTYYKIVNPKTKEEVPCGETGEIILRGLTVMAGYLKEPVETRLALQVHDDSNVWLHTGDLGYMDEDGYIYFKQRLKRMIVSRGYNIYPQNIENIINSHSSVLMCAVVGIADKIKGQKVKAFVVLKDSVTSSDELKKEVYNLCEKNIARYSLPEEIEFVSSLPKTLVGKIAYNELMKGSENE